MARYLDETAEMPEGAYERLRARLGTGRPPDDQISTSPRPDPWVQDTFATEPPSQAARRIPGTLGRIARIVFVGIPAAYWRERIRPKFRSNALDGESSGDELE
jgi:hypothetical protein